MHRTQRQRPAALHGAHERCKIGFNTRSIYQGWANDDHLHTGVSRNQPQTHFCLILALPVSILRIGYIGFSERATLLL